jgi:hypothetical protein
MTEKCLIMLDRRVLRPPMPEGVDRLRPPMPEGVDKFDKYFII